MCTHTTNTCTLSMPASWAQCTSANIHMCLTRSRKELQNLEVQVCITEFTPSPTLFEPQFPHLGYRQRSCMIQSGSESGLWIQEVVSEVGIRFPSSFCAWMTGTGCLSRSTVLSQASDPQREPGAAPPLRDRCLHAHRASSQLFCDLGQLSFPSCPQFPPMCSDSLGYLLILCGQSSLGVGRAVDTSI
jgi:hypothetical protein